MNQDPGTNAPGRPVGADAAQGLVSTLFDFSFSSFATTKFIKFIYGLLLVFAALGVLILVVSGFSVVFSRGLLMLIVSPVIAFVFIFIARIWTEMIIVIFRIAEHLKNMDAKTPPRA